MVGGHSFISKYAPLASPSWSDSPAQDFVVVSTDWGIGIVIDGLWDAWCLIPGWKDQGQNIGWLEALAVELVIYAVEERGIHDASLTVHFNNQGVIGLI